MVIGDRTRSGASAVGTVQGDISTVAEGRTVTVFVFSAPPLKWSCPIGPVQSGLAPLLGLAG